MKNIFKLISLTFFVLVLSFNLLHADTVNKIEITGNERISDETIELFSKITLNQKINQTDLNQLLKNLYDTNFFNDVSVKFINNILQIKVVENPIIENINYVGIKSERILDTLKENALIKSRYSFNEIILKQVQKM